MCISRFKYYKRKLTWLQSLFIVILNEIMVNWCLNLNLHKSIKNNCWFYLYFSINYVVGTLKVSSLGWVWPETDTNHWYCYSVTHIPGDSLSSTRESGLSLVTSLLCQSSDWQRSLLNPYWPLPPTQSSHQDVNCNRIIITKKLTLHNWSFWSGGNKMVK